MIKKLSNILLISLLLLSLSGCRLIGAIIIMSSYNVKLKINDRYVQSSNGMTNGIQFEKLTVIKLDEDGLPAEYIVTQRFECYNPGVEGVQEYWPDKIYFDKANGHYKWSADTVAIHFLQVGNNREVIVDSIENNNDLNDTPAESIDDFFSAIIIDSYTDYETCPVEFESNTWYYLNFYDPALATVFLYVESEKKLHLYKFDSGVSPI